MGDAAVPPRRRRRVLVLAGVLTLVLAGTGYASVTAAAGRGRRTPAAPVRAGVTTPVTRQTLAEIVALDGRLDHGPDAPLAVTPTGTVTWLPAPGVVLDRGDVVARVDEHPVVYLYGEVPSYRRLEGADPPLSGNDVRQLQRNLRALGHGSAGPDGRYTAATAAAVKRWQRALGVPDTGVVESGHVVFGAGAVRVARTTARLGAGSPADVLAVTGTARVVTLDVAVAAAAWAERGRAVTVELPDGTTAAGQVAEIGTTAEPAEAGAEPADPSRATVRITVHVAGQRALGRLEAGPVRVRYVGRERRDVLTVPVAALVALTEGGYGVESATGGFVAAATGLFADGRVEVSGPGLREGMLVRMPA